MKINIIGFYKIKKIKNPKKYKNLIKEFFSEKFVTGIVILAPEGINGTIAGKKNNVIECIKYIKKKLYIESFDNENFSVVGYQPFNKTKIKIKKEVVPIGSTLTPNEKKRTNILNQKIGTNLSRTRM